MRSINYNVSGLCARVSQKEAKITFSSSRDQSRMKWMCALCRCINVGAKSYRVFSSDVTMAMLVSLNKGTAAMLVFPTNPRAIEHYS